MESEAEKYLLSGEESKRLTDEAIAAARERGCVCTYPDVWMKSPDRVAWTAEVVEHDDCKVVRPETQHCVWCGQITWGPNDEGHMIVSFVYPFSEYPMHRDCYFEHGDWTP